MAYSSDESGSFQVYVSSFPGKEAKFQVTSAGGLHPFWSAGGKELFYISLERILMGSQVSTGARFEFSNPKPLFQTRVTTASVAGISPDGKRFLMPAILNPTTDTPIHVVTNWRAGVKP
jgi:Tol biopolymer transport system component